MTDQTPINNEPVDEPQDDPIIYDEKPKRKNDEQKKLYKAEKRGEIAGVSVGLADYFDIDVTIIRILFVILALSGGPGVLAYIILWIVMPDERDIYPERYDERGKYIRTS